MELTLDQIKDLLTFCKKERVQSVSFGSFKAEFSLQAMAFAPELSLVELTPEQKEEAAKKQEEDILFHSSG